MRWNLSSRLMEHLYFVDLVWHISSWASDYVQVIATEWKVLDDVGAKVSGGDSGYIPMKYLSSELSSCSSFLFVLLSSEVGLGVG